MRISNITSFFIAVVFVAVFFATTPLLSAGANNTNNFNTQVHPITVVELFTSEKFSSCPPKDRIASQINKYYKSQDKSVYVLAFPVGYWITSAGKTVLTNTIFLNDNVYTERNLILEVFTPRK